MSPSDRDRILMRRRNFVVASLAAGLGGAAVGCRPAEPEGWPRPCLSVPPPEPRPSVDAGSGSTVEAGSPSTIAVTELDAARPLEDGTHWTFDATKRRFVPREPMRFEGDRINSPPPHPSALDPAVARRMGNLADRFVPTSTVGATLDRRSYPALDELAELMLAGHWQATVQLEMEPDPTRCMGKLTAAKRAEAIRGYLIARGVAADRLLAEAKPVTNPPPRQHCPVSKEAFFQKVLVAIRP